jgi:cytochrome c-type biogenesis protein
MGLLTDVVTSFGLGLATPLTAVCVIPLYPGFLAYLASQSEEVSVARLAVLVGAGVLTFMLGLGLVFTTLLETSLTRVIGVVSPVAFGLLALLSLVLLADVPVSQYIPTAEPPQTSAPSLSALGYGLFFGAIVVPCNPGFIGIFFARSLLFSSPVSSLANFGAFGVGIAAPLMGLAVISEPWRDRVIAVLTSNRTTINRLTGGLMLAVSLYYLLFVFRVAGTLSL